IRFIDRVVVPVYDQNKKAMALLMVFTDVTEERQLAQARQDLSQMIVHDLRGPLMAVSTSLRILSEIAPGENPLRGSIQSITDNSQRAVRKLLNLVESILDIAKMESGNMPLRLENFEFRDMAKNVRAELLPIAEDLTINLDVEIAEDLPPLHADG